MNEPSINIDADDDAAQTSAAPARGRSRTRGAAPAEARALPRGQARGRNGEVITRNVIAGVDRFHIPDEVKEPGWSYQWLSEMVLNNQDVAREHKHTMYQAGWRPVMATAGTRWNGVFGPKEDTGHIIVSSMGLYERPAELTKQAVEEDKRNAVNLIRDRDQALQGAVKKMLPEGFEASRDAMKYKGRQTSRQMYIDPEANPLAQSYQPADDDVA